MPHIDPIARFWIGVAITAAIGITQGTVSLTHAVPDAWIPYITAWSGIIAFVGSGVLTALNGAASTTSSRLASAASLPDVARIQVMPTAATTQSITDLDKVIAVH